MIVVNKRYAQFVGQRTFLDPANQQVCPLFQHEPLQFGRIGVIQNDRAFVYQTVHFFIFFLATGLGADHHDFHADFAKLFDQGNRLETTANINRCFFSLQPGLVFENGRHHSRGLRGDQRLRLLTD